MIFDGFVKIQGLTIASKLNPSRPHLVGITLLLLCKNHCSATSNLPVSMVGLCFPQEENVAPSLFGKIAV